MEQALLMTEKLASVGRLAASIAHEINNPLEAVTNLLYLAKRDIGNREKAEKHLQSATHELDRVTHITQQTLGFYRDNSSPVNVNPSQILDEVIFLYAKKIEARGVKVLREYDENATATLLEGEVRQVFSNLISNALDAMPTGGTLRLRVSNSHKWDNFNLPGIRITVADTGSGILLERRKRLFEPFYTTKKDVGTGLGLWITRGIVEKHRGMIHVRSKTGASGSGTAFSIFLPIKMATREPEPAESSQESLSLTHQISV
jgi:signal transduction histidine kinase